MKVYFTIEMATGSTNCTRSYPCCNAETTDTKDSLCSLGLSFSQASVLSKRPVWLLTAQPSTYLVWLKWMTFLEGMDAQRLHFKSHR